MVGIVIAMIIGKKRGVKILLQIGSLPLPLIIIGSVAISLTAKVTVLFNPDIPIQDYVSWIAGVVGTLVFGYTLFWFERIKDWVDKTAHDVVEQLDKAKKEGEK